tara:strand:- start:347 stop:1867 length:1521 start_codon:yes stop_codon:yes gene_type:complete
MKPILDKKYKIYEFEIFSLNTIEKIYGKGRKYGVGKFISKLYKRKICLQSVDENDSHLLNKGYVYLPHSEIVRYLGVNKKDGEYEWKTILKSLSKRGIVSYKREGNNPYDSNKKLYYFRLSDDFDNSKKTYVDVESNTLNKFISKQNSKYVSELSKGKGLDIFLLYELDVCIKSTLSIKDLDDIIDLRVNNKLTEYRDKLEWEWLGKRQRKKIYSKLVDEEVFIERYKRLLKSKYEILQIDLQNLRDGNYFDLSTNYFKRDEYGYRVYNIFSRCIREYRSFIKIDGEETIEVDLKNSMISMLYYFIKLLNDKPNKQSGLVKDVYNKLIQLRDGEINDVWLGLPYLQRWEYIKDYGDKFNNDYYLFLKEESGFENMSRNSFKELLWLILFGRESQLKKSINLNKHKYDDLKHLLLGSGRFLVEDITKIDLYKWNKKNYRRYKNTSLILHTIERLVMETMSTILIEKKYKYISIFDGFIVKKSQSEEIHKLLNSRVSSIDKVFTFTLK